MLKLVGAVVGLALLAAAYVWATLSWNYSTGERAGWVQKLSRKGWICKTWEGEMAMVTMPGTVAEKFFFTVRDDEVAKKINATVGSRVVLNYDEHKFIPISCFGDTGHFVTGVRVSAEPSVPFP
jgi:hypothetical protein